MVWFFTFSSSLQASQHHLNAAPLISCFCLKQSPFHCTAEMAPAALGKTADRYDWTKEALDGKEYRVHTSLKG